MEMEITVPDEVPVMTLPNTAFFPQALMPLYIFEPRYRQMLREALRSNRLFAVAGVNPKAAENPGAFEPPHRIATLGIIRACQEAGDGTSHLLLHGICRVEITRVVRDDPFRLIQIRALTSAAGGPEAENESLRREIARLLRLKLRLAATAAAEMTDFLKGIQDPEAFVDIAAFSLCDDVVLKQRLLETLDVRRRLQLFGARLKLEIEQLKLRRKLQGGLPDERITEN